MKQNMPEIKQPVLENIQNRPFSILIYYDANCLSNLPASIDFGTAPICLSTISPFLKYNKAGMLRIPNFIEMPGLLSTFTLPTTALPSYSLAISSTTGPTMRQGPHHSAQKSISTGLFDFSTSSSKFASVISKAMIFFPLFIFSVTNIYYSNCLPQMELLTLW